MTGGDGRQVQVGGREPVQDVGLDGVEARRGKSAALGSMGGIAVDPEAQPHQVEDVLRHGVVFRRTDFGPEAICRHHLVQKKSCQLAARRDGARDLVLDVPAQVLEQLLRDARAPATALGLPNPRRLAIGDGAFKRNPQNRQHNFICYP